MRWICVMLFMSAWSIFNTQSAYDILMEKAVSFEEENNWEQARYYYVLAKKQLDTTETKNDVVLAQKIFAIDSIVAYQKEYDDFVNLIAKGDSLFKWSSAIYALKAFDDASKLVPGVHYVSARIDQIIESSPEIKEKLFVLQSNYKRQQYEKELNRISEKEHNGKALEAYYDYLKLQKGHTENAELGVIIGELKVELHKQIEQYESLLSIGGNAYQKGDYPEAKNAYSEALELNEECQECLDALEFVDYYLRFQKSDSLTFNVLRGEADLAYKIGDYESALLKYGVLSNMSPADSLIVARLSELQEILSAEYEADYRRKSANLLLEKANKLFMEYHYEEALENYLIIEKRYLDVIDFEGFLTTRIADCILALEKN